MKPPLTTTEIIKRFVSLHGSKFDYSKVEYRSNEKLTIICKIHGEFKQLYIEQGWNFEFKIF